MRRARRGTRTAFLYISGAQLKSMPRANRGRKRTHVMCDDAQHHFGHRTKAMLQQATAEGGQSLAASCGKSISCPGSHVDLRPKRRDGIPPETKAPSSCMQVSRGF